MASAQVLNPLIPSKKNDRLLREQAEREKARKERDTAAAAKRAQEKAATLNPTPSTTANGRAGYAAATTAATDTPAATATADTTTLEFIPSDSIIVNPMQIAPITTTTTEYDPVTGQYLLRTKIGDVEIATPTLLTAEEYRRYNEQKVMNRYWQQKISEVGHSNEKKFDITDMKFNIGPADRVFGPGGVQLKMQGSAELLFGFKHQHIENPSLTQKARNNNIFDFDEKIQASVQGKVGTRLNFNMSYNTESSFSFDQQNLKLAYKGEDDDIIQSLEAGNVTMDLNSSLIQGSKALFGVKANLKFGKLKVQALISQQNSEATTVNSQGGAQMTPFEVTADNYDENRHFFLSYFFRDRYEEAMKTLPYVASGITINKIEVWITNKKANFDNARNLIAFVDLGESGPYNYAEGRNQHIFNKTWASQQLQLVAPQNTTNKLYTDLSSQNGIRDISNVSSVLDELGYGIESGEDFEKIESARLLTSSEYILNAALGYISLKTALHEDEVLAVAYEYTYQGNVYQVGEFSTDAGADLKAPNALFVKLLKSNGNSPNKKDAGTWDLMMKNIYSIGAASVSQDKFELNIYYRNDSIGTDLMYIDEGNIKGRPLLRVMGLDRLDSKNNTFSDGKFDFIPGYTVLTSTGRIIFPALEPFGNYLREQIGNPTIADKYSFQELYDSTRVSAEEFTERNKFLLKGKYLGSGGNEISLGAMNVPRGSVKVTAGGATLIENVDYTVDYMMGKVTILNESIIESGTNVSVSLENQSTFSMQRKTLLGAHLEYQFNPDLVVGGTIMYMSEKPLTTKVNSGSEPIANTIWGLNFAWRTELPWLNTAINAIPWMKAEAPSTFSINGEFAHLIPGHTRDVGSAGTAYIDDFEATQTGIDVHYPSYWHLCATPRNENANDRPFAKEDATKINDIKYNSNRAHLAWYTVDPIFGYPQSNTPNHIRDRVDILSDHRTRIVYEQEIYPNKEVLANEDTRLAVLNLSFYPEERGQYNIDASQFGRDGKLKDPYNKWGGMMRKLDNTDFERSNIEYIEFWMMDPKLTNDEDVDVDLYFNLGDLSEDILRDGKKSFENGLPTSATDSSRTTTSMWGRVPKTNSTVMAFSNEAGSRQYQDLGLNGLNDEQEYNFRHISSGVAYTPYKDFVDALRKPENIDPDTIRKWEADPFSPLNDPAGDNYHYYRGSDYDQQEVSVLDRYKHYNGTQGNSPATEQQTESYGTAASLQPDVEDINLDNTLSEYEKYYEYKVHINRDLKVGEQYVVSETKSNVTLRNGKTEQVTWYQFKIPLKGDGMEKVGTIRNFKSIRFMRMYMTHSEKPVHLRFGSLDLVRGEWRSYNKPLYEPQYEGLVNPGASLDVQAVNIEENGTRHPVNYILPPGISRQTDPGQAQLIAQNEQAMVLRVHNLAPHDGRAVYKGTAFDMRNYKRLQMFIHAEKDSVGGDPDLSDGDLSCFIRLGTDLKNNYYEYEIPLELTPAGIYNNNNENDRYRVWPKANYMDFALSNLVAAKTARNRAHRSGAASVNIHTPYVVYDVDDGRPDSKITVLGNPTLEDVEYILIGVRNSGTTNHSGEVWVNELRLSEFDESGGVAAMANVSLAISDIAQFNASGRIETAGYGSIESNVLTRNKEDNYQISLSAALEAGRLLPEKAKLQIPLYVSYSNNTTKPKYDPLDSDVKLSESLDTYNTTAERDSVKALANRVQTSTSFSVTNMKVNIKSKKQDMFYDPANFSISASYNRQQQRTPEVQKDITTEQRGSFQYAFNFNPKPWEPFKDVKKVDKIKALKEFNIYYLPQSWSFTTSMQRQFSETIQRDLTNSGYSVQDLTTYSKDFTWDRHFDFKYNLTKNMKFSFQTAMNSTVEEGTYTPEIIRDWAFTNDYYEAWKDTIRRSLAKWGAPYAYQQVFTASWSVPFNRIPYVEALTANATYNANYNWTRTQSSSNSGNNSLGNTITSTRSIQLDGGINFETLYQKSKYWKQMTQHYTGRQRARAFKPKTYTQTISLKKGVPQEITHRLGSTQLTVTAADSTGKRVPVTFRALDNNKVSVVSRADGEAVALTITTRDPNKRSAAQITGDMFAYLGTMIRRVQITYRNTNSMAIPGFAPEVGFMGQGKTDAGFAPGYDFAFGFFKDNYVSRAQERGWLSGDTSVVQPATISKTSDLDIKIQLEPLPGLKIALSGKRYNASSTSIIYSYGDLRENLSGSFNTTQIAIGTAFASIGSPSDNFASSVFDQFLANRDVMRTRVQERYEGVPYPTQSWMAGNIYSADGKYHKQDEGTAQINPNSADVLVPAFLAAYSGKDINKMGYNPFLGILKILPNWSVTYDGLGKIAGIRDHFKSFTLTHAYTCKYSIGSYSSFSTWVPANGSDKTLGFIRDVATGNPVPSSAYDISSVTLSETFSPLIGVNMTLKNSLSFKSEYRRQRNLALSVTALQITEGHTEEFVIGAGYTIKNLNAIVKKGNGGQTKVSNDLKLSVDISYKNVKSFLRKFGDEIPIAQASSGTKVFTLKFAADYVISQKVNLQLYYDHEGTTPLISTSYPVSTDNVGINLKFMLTR